ncbi:MAG: hypothetical protein ACKOFH_12675, partial [Chthoniobacterales bacterium]
AQHAASRCSPAPRAGERAVATPHALDNPFSDSLYLRGRRSWESEKGMARASGLATARSPARVAA